MNMGYIHHNSENKIFLPIYGYVVYLFIIFALDISQYHRAFDRFARQSSQPSHFLGCKLGRESVERCGTEYKKQADEEMRKENVIG